MKRTPLWVFVAAAAVQIAALWLCVWAMESFAHPESGERAEEPPPSPPRPPRPRQPEALAPASEPLGAQTLVTPPPPAPEPAPVAAVPPAAAPLFGPPPSPESGAGDLRFVTEIADDATQIVTSDVDGRPMAFGFYADGNIRFVDVDGGRYAGKAESARARMREAGGLRAFTVQIGVAVDGRLAATFTGGLHDAETFVLEPMVGWSIA
ncbi:MAG TPA: hypothetical protein VGN14_01070 [Candidatus Elarobacter sp.]